MVSASASTPEDSIAQFENRMLQLVDELHDINRELGNVDVIALAHRTQDLLHRTKGLLDGNVTVLFHREPPRVAEDLYKHIEYAETQIAKALSEEYQFEAIKQRLYMASSLSQYVIDGVSGAIERLKQEGF